MVKFPRRLINHGNDTKSTHTGTKVGISLENFAWPEGRKPECGRIIAVVVNQLFPGVADFWSAYRFQHLRGKPEVRVMEVP